MAKCTWAKGLLFGVGGALILVAPLHAAPIESEIDASGASAVQAQALDILADEAAGPTSLRRAMIALRDRQAADSTSVIAAVVADGARDPMTRAIGATAIGALRRGQPRSAAPPSVTAAFGKALEHSQPLLLRLAAARAAGRGGLTDLTSTLLAIRNEEAEGPALRFAAAQALTRMTGRVYLTSDIMNAFRASVQQDLIARRSGGAR